MEHIQRLLTVSFLLLQVSHILTFTEPHPESANRLSNRQTTQKSAHHQINIREAPSPPSPEHQDKQKLPQKLTDHENSEFFKNELIDETSNETLNTRFKKRNVTDDTIVKKGTEKPLKDAVDKVEQNVLENVINDTALTKLSKRYASDKPQEYSTEKQDYVTTNRYTTDRMEENLFDSIYDKYNIDKGIEKIKIKLINDDNYQTRGQLNKRQTRKFLSDPIPINCEGFLSPPITTNINTYSVRQAKDSEDEENIVGSSNDVGDDNVSIDNEHLHHFVQFLHDIRPHVVDPELSANSYYLRQSSQEAGGEESMGDSEIEKAERLHRSFENMIKYATILGHVDSFVTGRARSVVRALGRIYDEDESDRRLRARKRRFTHKLQF
ncbi:uncharacterized protein [Anabrus simplex]|uniref:uncharacterized protein isoform X2 n=1 Tax=Anabrus simplex TaxID=316456 RepID=UPI0035A3CD24